MKMLSKLVAAGGTLGLAVATPGLPAHASDVVDAAPPSASCASLASPHAPTFNNSAKTVYASGAVRKCGAARKACVYIQHGRAVPPRGVQWRTMAGGCVLLTHGQLVRPRTRAVACEPGYYYVDLRIYNASNAQMNRQTSRMYDGTGCWAD